VSSYYFTGLAFAADDFISVMVIQLSQTIWRMSLSYCRLLTIYGGDSLAAADYFVRWPVFAPAMTDLVCVAVDGSAVYFFICLQTSSSRADILPPLIVEYFNS
jgi:hypothetical protein